MPRSAVAAEIILMPRNSEAEKRKMVIHNVPIRK
jgi:hypothetical protein